jgi:hypothetical protein
MSGGLIAPQPLQARVGSHIWAAEVPWLPDLLASSQSSLTGRPLHDAFGRQMAFLRAVAAGAPHGTALQLRFLSEPDANGESGVVRTLLLGRGPSEDSATELARLVVATLPQEFPLEPLPPDAVPRTLRPFDTDRSTKEQWVEVRRALETLDPASEHRGDAELVEPVLVPWAWSPQALLSSLGLLRRQPGTCVLGVHLEPEAPTPELILYLQREASRFQDLASRDEQNPLVITGLRAYRRWLRELPRGALHLRVYAAASQPLLGGLAAAIGSDLTRTWESSGGPDALLGTFSTVAPRDERELDAVSLIVDDLTAPRWRVPKDPDLAQLQFLFDPHEANSAFRIPVSPRGGLPGISTARISTLPAGRELRAPDASSVIIGQGLTSGDFSLTTSEINRHVLVAGLPGFGKTTTVHALLTELTRQPEPVPFLVIDPAKSDYRRLVADLGAEGTRVRHVALGPDHVAFNPFAVPAGVHRLSHLGRVLAAFDAAFAFSATWPAGHILLGRALHEAYEAYETPTLNNVYRSAGEVLRRARYGKVGDDIRAALLGRLEFLAHGPAGRALLGSRHAGVDFDALTAAPAVVELGRFSGPQERSLLFGLLLAGLVSHREANPAEGLAHVTVLEEAHRVLRAGASEGVELFADAIAELRGAGEGFIIVDQAPTLLHPAVMKLTGSKLAHRIVDADERAAVARSMLLDAQQEEELSRIGPGRLIALTADMTAPALVSVTPPRETGAAAAPADRHHLGEAVTAEPMWCLDCPTMCTGQLGLRHLDEVGSATAGRPAAEVAAAALQRTQGRRDEAYCLAAFLTVNRSPTGGGALRRELDAVRRSLETRG